MANKNYKYQNGKLEVYISEKWREVTFDGYEFIDEISSGANGVVLKARHNITERVDAIKIWLPHKRSTNGSVSEEQYLREIRKISHLKNSNIAVIYDAKTIDNKIYMCAMEYIEGIPLKEWIKTNHYINNRVEVCRKILKTVLEYQSVGIIHGDLHGGNILIDGNDDIHLIDFGTSLFGRDNQSKQRESYFLVDLVKQLLGEYFVKECFQFENYNMRTKIIDSNDSRNYEPLLITKTLINYIKLIHIKLGAGKLRDNSIIGEYCYSVSHGIYFNLDGIFNEMLTWNDKNIARNFATILYSNIEYTIFNTEDDKKMEDIKYSTLFIYYEMFKEIRHEIDFIEAEEDYLKKYHNRITSEKYKVIINKLRGLTHGSYIDCQHELINNDVDDDDIRGILYSALKSFYKERTIIILYDIWTRLNVLWLNKELHNNIFQLSDIVQENKWEI